MPALRTRDTQPRSLEVTTDAPQPPSFSIISPTPRAFSFAVNMPASDSPYASPSHSPFEPDLRSLSISTSSSVLLPPHQQSGPLSPESPLKSSSSPAPFSQYKRRKSSSCSTIDLERRPRKGDEDYVKRPENAFILFRRHCCEERQAAQEEAASGPSKKERQADLSKTISQRWKGLTAEERQHWENEAKKAKKKHEEMYPNYVYRPQRKDKDRSKLKKFNRDDVEESELETINVMVPVPQPYRNNHGRSSSAPTPPPPYQQIQVPNVYQLTPSCSTSPSLMPMISRRTSHPAYLEDSSSGFDYIPNDNFSFAQAGQLEASLQSSEFLRSMFSMPVDPRDALHPLTISQDSNHLPHQSVVSPASSVDSNPSSPYPFTPAHPMAAQPFVVPEPRTQTDLDLQMQHCCPTYWDPNVLWPTNNEILLSDDFDLSAIPPIELGIPKYPQAMELEIQQYGGGGGGGAQYGEIMASAQYCDESQYQDGSIMAFDEMMGGPPGF